MPKKMQTIFIDADACPVPIKQEIQDICRNVPVDVLFVASYAHVMNEEKNTKWIIVDSNREEVDLYIVNHVIPNDFVITQDYGLASILLPKGVYVLSPRGKRYLEKNIDDLLYMRHLSSKERRAGNRVKGPKPFRKEDKERFSEEFKKVLKKEGLL
ncbi:YaiI/YqxD family protein [Bacillus taeanensis]|uniref:UPF0178 protein DS031_05690 n=1 Tax=Bacillus taeanensis TaxID=273032 RepID=A0A366XX94_9BACI|nr:YaiI/YqxD family protein [Bacillus taeanensis]RBW70517.1 YaiI/YqxD family protein [Bacillus taeanensis]